VSNVLAARKGSIDNNGQPGDERVYAASSRTRSRVPVTFATFAGERVHCGVRLLSSRAAADRVVLVRAAAPPG